jgi:glucose/arabinose dehydrogenase/sugar lactone lactonase YvrE
VLILGLALGAGTAVHAQFNVGRGAVDALYQQHCAACHGRQAEGGSGGPLLGPAWRHGGTDEALARVIAQGVPGTPMPPWQTVLSEPQIRSLVIYLREQARLAQFPAAEPIRPEEGTLTGAGHTFRLEPVATLAAREAGTDATLWGFVFLPDGALLATQRDGTLWRFGAEGRTRIAGTPAVWHDGGETGLFDVQLHPDHARNGWVYLAYSERLASAADTAPRGMTVIVRGRVRDGRWIDEQTVYRAAPEFYTAAKHHFGGRMFFHADHLFFAIGDRVDEKAAQDPASPFGKIHRVRADGTIPGDNPWHASPGAITSVWSRGNRNAQGFARDPATGELWASEHGPRGGDELNVIARGENYGWPLVTHGMNYDGQPLTAVTELPGMTAPRHQWTPSIAVAGMTFYTGRHFPAWQGRLLVGGMWAEELRCVTIRAGRVEADELVFRGRGRVRHVANGPEGALYVSLTSADLSRGGIYRLTPVAPVALEARVPEEFHRVFAPHTELRTLVTGLKFAEGPLWVGGALLFSDIPASRTLRWSPHAGLAVVREPTGWGNGHALDGQGRLLTAEHHGRRISVRAASGEVTTLADRFEGQSLNSPNDVVVKSDGTVWFTDPDYGILHPPAQGPRPVKAQPHNGVYRFDPRTGVITAVVTDFAMPNGLCFSPDESRLYVSDSGEPAHVREFPVHADGLLGPGRIFRASVAAPAAPDGLKVDEEGRVYCVAADGVEVLAPDGRMLGTLRLPAKPSNFCFGGEDGRTLFITTPNALYAVPTLTRAPARNDH